jgi:hypothetical protein
MKKHIITALLITTMISMTACGGKNTDTPAEATVETTEASGELPTANDEKVVLGTLNKEETATAETTTEEKTDAKATTSPDPKATDAPKSTAAPETTAKPKSTTKPGTQTASVTATTKPAATEKPKSTTAPKATATPAPKATEAPKATATPKATPTPTAAPVVCQHTNTHVESSHDTYEVPIAGGCYEVWRTATRVCNDCGANLGEAPEKVNEVHTNVVHKQGVSATCTTDGYSAVYGCDCDSQPEVGGDVIPAFGHDYHDEFDHEEVDENGQTHIYFHSVCYTCGAENGSWEVGN